MAKVSKLHEKSDSKDKSGKGEKFINLNDLRNKKNSELIKLARDSGVDDTSRMSKQDLITVFSGHQNTVIFPDRMTYTFQNRR